MWDQLLLCVPLLLLIWPVVRAVGRRWRWAGERGCSVGVSLVATSGVVASTGATPPLGDELKFFDTSLAFTFDATGEVPATGQLVLIPQGVTESTRVGRKCTIKSLQMKGSLNYVPAAAATAATTVFLYLVLDQQCNGAAAAVTDVLTGNGLQVAFRNLANGERFRILKKIKVTLAPGAGVTTAYNNSTRHFEFYLKCHYPIEFSSTTGAITEIRSNNLFLLAGSDGNTDDLVTMNGACRVRFSDQG